MLAGAAGYCTSTFGSAFLIASRTVIQPPLAPGTAPSTRIRPRASAISRHFVAFITDKVLPDSLLGPFVADARTQLVKGFYERPMGSGDGAVEGQVIPVDINLVGDRASTSGCEPADFAGADWSGVSSFDQEGDTSTVW